MRASAVLALVVAAVIGLIAAPADAAVPPTYWSVHKAEARLEQRERVFGRPVARAECEGTGTVLRRHGRNVYGRFDCAVFHPRNYVSFVVVRPTARLTFRVRVVGGIA